MLQEATSVITTSCREDDLVFRWRGDEVVILLPNTNPSAVKDITDRIRKNSRQSDFKPIGINLSLGSATLSEPERDYNLKDTIQTAEDRMYRDKMDRGEEISGEVLDAIVDSLEQKAKHVIDHCNRIEKLTEDFGRHLKLKENRLDKLKTLSKFHDIGKVAIDEEILNKTSEQFTDKEKIELCRHVNTGYQIMDQLQGLNGVAKPL